MAENAAFSPVEPEPTPSVFEEALAFAVAAHRGMSRKRESAPFILHPLEAAVIVGTMTADPEVLAAAVLHDTVEDGGISPGELRSRFGDRVADLVASETENKHPEMPRSESWRLRKEESLEKLHTAEDPGVRMLWLGDKLSNMRSFYRGWKIAGDSLWNSFHQKDPAAQAWYYRTIDELLSDLHGYEAWQEYHFMVTAVFEGVE